MFVLTECLILWKNSVCKWELCLEILLNILWTNKLTGPGKTNKKTDRQKDRQTDRHVDNKKKKNH